jgi:hypothetical protein
VRIVAAVSLQDACALDYMPHTQRPLFSAADYFKLRQCGTGGACENATCDPMTGACDVPNMADGAVCGSATQSGTCKGGACGAMHAALAATHRQAVMHCLPHVVLHAKLAMQAANVYCTVCQPSCCIHPGWCR